MFVPAQPPASRAKTPTRASASGRRVWILVMSYLRNPRYTGTPPSGRTRAPTPGLRLGLVLDELEDGAGQGDPRLAGPRHQRLQRRRDLGEGLGELLGVLRARRRRELVGEVLQLVAELAGLQRDRRRPRPRHRGRPLL